MAVTATIMNTVTGLPLQKMTFERIPKPWSSFTLSTGELVKMMYGHTKPVESMAFHPNNWLFASGSRDGSVGLWNASKGIGNLRIEASSRPINCVGFSPDGKRLAAGGQDKMVRVWEVSAKDEG